MEWLSWPDPGAPQTKIRQLPLICVMKIVNHIPVSHAFSVVLLEIVNEMTERIC